jgi:hypothetical protein
MRKPCKPPTNLYNEYYSCLTFYFVWVCWSILSALVQPRGFVWVCCSIFNLLCCGLWTIVNLFVRLPVIALLRYGPSWSWSYGSGIYNYLCNQCLSPLMFVSSNLYPTKAFLMKWKMLYNEFCPYSWSPFNQ